MLEALILSFSSVSFFSYLFIFGVFIIGITAACHAVIYKREPRAALGWFAFIVAAPIIGTLFYILFGLNRIQRKGLRFDALYPKKSLNIKQLPVRNDRKLEYKNILTVGENLAYSPICSIDQISPLNTGDQAYPAMIKSINQASKSIYLYSYIFEVDGATDEVISSLIKAKERGVLVRVLVDGVGSKATLNRLQEKLERAQISFAIFLPVIWNLHFANLRNHRKILIIDNEVAFTGGLNIAQAYWPEKAGDDHVLDFHFMLKGEISAYIQAVFVDDWLFATGENLDNEIGSTIVQSNATPQAFGRVVIGGPGENTEKIQWHFISAVNSAKKTIRIVTPYFLPSKEVLSALIYSSLRGVKVDIIIPESTDSRLTTWAQMASLFDLLVRGCNIYLSPAPFDHSKFLIIDEEYVSLGSANWDVRSFRLNFEMNVEVSSDQLAGSLIEAFESKKRQSDLYSLEDHDERSIFVKLRGGFARMLTPYL